MTADALLDAAGKQWQQDAALLHAIDKVSRGLLVARVDGWVLERDTKVDDSAEFFPVILHRVASGGRPA